MLGLLFCGWAHLAGSLPRARADALVLFNRFYQPDFDIEARTVVPSLALSRPEEIRLPLMWISLLYGRVNLSLAATTGVHGPIEVIKYLMAGADVVMATSALLMEGPAFVSRTLSQLTGWMERHGYASVRQMRGCMSHELVGDPTALVRANYVRSIQSHVPRGPWQAD
jgi:dihydroorotate dehydrogenase (fumarate)